MQCQPAVFPLYSHPIGILMSAAGRFVVCIDCHLSVEFPAGAHYDVIARQFESHLCDSQRPLNDDALSGKTITAAATSEVLKRFDFDRMRLPCGSSTSVLSPFPRSTMRQGVITVTRER